MMASSMDDEEGNAANEEQPRDLWQQTLQVGYLYSTTRTTMI